MNDRVRELDIFLRVAAHASFSATARSLDLDPSTISKIVHRLESRIGTRLFHRTSRKLRLTQEGERYLVSAQRVITALDEVETSLRRGDGEITGVLRVHSTPAFAVHRLAPLMPAFAQRHPALRVEFLLSATPPDLRENQIDVSLQSGLVPDGSLYAHRVGATRWLLCAAPSYLASFGTPEQLSDLATHACLNFLPGAYRSHWPGTASEPGIAPAASIAANSGDMLCRLARAGMGIARLADFHVHDDLHNGTLKEVLTQVSAQTEPLYAVYPARRHMSPRTEAFVTFLAQELEHELANANP